MCIGDDIAASLEATQPCDGWARLDAVLVARVPIRSSLAFSSAERRSI